MAFSLAGASPSLAEAPAFSLEPKDLQQLVNQQAGVTTASTVVLLADEHWTFHADHTVERKQHTILKILDQSAVEAWSSVQARWEPWHQERPTYRARVITPDGAAHQFDPHTLVEGPAGSNSPQTYSDLRVVQGPLPAVSVGAIVESELTERQTLVLGSIAFRGYLAWMAPVRSSRILVDYPESLPFRYVADLCPELKETKEVRAGVVHLTLSFGSFEALKEIEPLLPFDAPRTATITLSTAASWNDLAVQYGKVVDQQIGNAAIRELVSQTLNGETNRAAMIEKLVSRLHAEVRYTGVEFADAAIVPAQPAETLQRKYGDCKDKASLLIAMLRAANISAYVALLNAGLDQDVAASQPGMGMFNHAIVYVPGTPALWIDATAEHMQVGSLPPQDQGRLALIVRPETKDLTKVPESASAENLMQTTIDYHLPDFGPSHIVQALSVTGSLGSTYRELSGMLDNAEIRRNAEKQAQAEWDTKSDVKFSYPPRNDTSKPFLMTTDVPNAKVVTVSETGGAITLPVGNVFATLPAFFGTEEPKDTDAAQKKKARTVGFVLPVAFIEKMSLRIHVPAGFALKKLPEDRSLHFGPAAYTAHYALKDGMLTADVAFDAEKRNYTLDEGNALRKGLLEFMKQPATVVNFEPLGQALLAEGKLREGLDAFRRMAAEHKEQAVNHVRLARAYLATGCGEEARKEAKAAMEGAPTLALTWRNLAFVEEHDLLGRKYKPDWDPAATEAALRKAMLLDADDLSAPIELAESFSYDAQGEQWLAKDRLKKALEVLHGLGDDKLERRGVQDTLIYTLAVLGDLDEMKAKLERFGANGSRAGYHIFLTAVREGAVQAASEVKGLPAGEEAKQSFLSAANLLARTGRYQLEGDLAAGSGFASQLFMPAANLRNVRPMDWRAWKTDSPENVVKSFIAAESETSENADSLARFWSHPSSPTLHALLERWQQSEFYGLKQRGLIASVAMDVYFSSTTAATDTNGPNGVRVRLTSMGRTMPMLVVREQSGFKLLGYSKYPEGVARQVVADLDAGHPEVARKWLDWLREEVKIRSEDDPLGGPVFPRLWNKGATATPIQIRRAAATLMNSPEALPILREAMGSTSDATVKAYYQLAYADVCIDLKRWADCVPVAKALAEAYPASETALRLLSRSLAGAGQVDAAEALLKKAMAGNNDNLASKRELVTALSWGKRLKECEQVAKETAETPAASASDWNQYGWVSLFAGDTNDEKIHAVERASSQPNPAIENTIAAMYAETGRANEARQISLQALDRSGYKTPDSSWWYVFGRIAEQLGANESAAADYAKVKPDANGDDPLSTHVLAQKRLALLSSSQR